MENADEERYMSFLTTHWCKTQFVEFHCQRQLMAVAVTDVLPNVLSAVYTFFDPALERFSPGVLAILWQIEEARRRGLEYLYLGYWIAESPKMAYKIRFRPAQILVNNEWVTYDGPG